MAEKVYCIDGVRGRHLDVYGDRIVISIKPGIGSLLTGNASDGEKTIYYRDAVGVQFKKSGIMIGYLQIETASSQMNNQNSNLYSENSFTFDTSKVSNQKMEEVADYVKQRVAEIKNAASTPVATISPADELKKFKELLDMGVISQEEFDAKKKQILDL